MLYLPDRLPSGGPPETKEKSLEAFDQLKYVNTNPLPSQVIQMLTELSDTSLGKRNLCTSWGRDTAASGGGGVLDTDT